MALTREIILLVGALILCCAGVYLLRVLWRKQNMIGVICAWGLITVAAIGSSVSVGAEFGVAYVLMAFSVIGAVIVFSGAQSRPVKEEKNRPPDTSPFWDVTSKPHKWATFFIAGPVTGIVSCMAVAGLSQFLPFERPSQMVFAAFIYPFIWAIATVWICSAQRLLNAVVVLITTAILSTLALFV